MLTRKGYVELSKKFKPHRFAIQRLLFWVWISAFTLVPLVWVTGRPDIVVNWGGRMIASAWFALGVIAIACDTFNPEWDPVAKSPNEEWAVIVLNAMLAMSILIWIFWWDS